MTGNWRTRIRGAVFDHELQRFLLRKINYCRRAWDFIQRRDDGQRSPAAGHGYVAITSIRKATTT